LSTELTSSSGFAWALQRFYLWLEFFYFATTTFTTVGFGDIYPINVISRQLVTVINMLTVGYVVFLLQTLLGQGDDS
jgi:hypothetical protein